MLWVVVGVETSVGWPTAEIRVDFRGRELILRPETDTLAPSVVAGYEPPETYEQTLLLMREFLSSLAWVEQKSIREVMTTGGGFPIRVGKSPGFRVINPSFRVDYLQDPRDPRTRLALALYREALGVDSVPYKFLGFFKIINILYPKGPDQVRWINATLDLLENYEAKARAADLRATGEDIGEYLYVSGRCAVSHANTEPIVNPEKPEDTERLARDMPLIRGLAEYFIERELGVQSLRTVYREHLYELDGFRNLFGAEVVVGIKSMLEIHPAQLPALPRLSIRVRDSALFTAFEGMDAQVLEARNGKVLMRCASRDTLVDAGLVLDFAEERLGFDPLDGVVIQDDGSPQAVQNAIDRVQLLKVLLGNGQLEVWDVADQELLGRTDPFIPQNIDLAATIENLDRRMEALAAELRRRSEARERTAGQIPTERT